MGLVQDIKSLERYYALKLKTMQVDNKDRAAEIVDYKKVFDIYKKKNALLNSAVNGDCTLEWALDQIGNKNKGLKKYLPIKRKDQDHDDMVQDLSDLLNYNEPLLKTGQGNKEMLANYGKKNFIGGAIGGGMLGTAAAMSTFSWAAGPWLWPVAIAGTVGTVALANTSAAQEMKKRYKMVQDAMAKDVDYLDKKIKLVYHS